jgi:type IV pilus assembly protein PilE
MIALVIIGVLALLAIPRFMSVTTRAKMAEAKLMLRHVLTLEQAYYYEYDRYSGDLSIIGFEQERLVTEGGTARYLITIEEASPSAFVAAAVSIVDFDKDGQFNEWVVSEAGLIEQRLPD